MTDPPPASRPTLSTEDRYFISCRGVNLFLLKYATIATVNTATVTTVTTVTITTVTI